MASTTQQSYFDNSFREKGNYTGAEWRIREDYYLDKIKSLYIPPNCTPKDVTALSADIANVLGEARWDWMNSKKGFDQWDTIIGAQEKIQFNNVKSAAGTIKLTVDEVKGEVAKYINDASSHVCMQYPALNGMSLAQVMAVYTSRMTFIEMVIKSVLEKHQALILQTSMLKIDSNVGVGNNFSNNGIDPNMIP